MGQCEILFPSLTGLRMQSVYQNIGGSSLGLRNSLLMALRLALDQEVKDTGGQVPVRGTVILTVLVLGAF